MAEIKACKHWNDTKINLTEGKRYRFSARGIWIDKNTEATACGLTSDNYANPSLMRFFEKLRRMPEAKWFSLIGAIDRDKKRFSTLESS